LTEGNNKVKQLISDASTGDPEAYQEIKTAVGVLNALRTLRETKTLRQALMILACSYFESSLQAVGEIFHVGEKTVKRDIGKKP